MCMYIYMYIYIYLCIGDFEQPPAKDLGFRVSDFAFLEPPGSKELLITGLLTRLIMGVPLVRPVRELIIALISPRLSSYYLP